MQAVLFLLGLWCCFLASTAALECYVDGTAQPLKNSNCEACGYHLTTGGASCGLKLERFCLSENSMKYEDLQGQQTFNKSDECVLESKGCYHMVYICHSDLCNLQCGFPIELSESNAGSPSQVLPESENNDGMFLAGPSRNAMLNNHGNLQGVSQNVFGLITLLFLLKSFF